MSEAGGSLATSQAERIKVSEGTAPAVDGAPLWYCSEGEGPTLVLCNGLGVSTFFWNQLRASFAGPYRVVTWDYRGHGHSGPAPQSGFDVPACTEDLRRLMDHLEIDQAVLVGHSMGSQVILEAFRRYSDRIQGLVPVLGGYGRTVETFFDTRASLYAMQAMRKVAMLRPSITKSLVSLVAPHPLTWKVAQAAGFVHPDLCPREEMGPYLDHLIGLDLNVYFQLVQAIQDHDASDVLPGIDVPTLVFAGDMDVFTPMSLSEEMAARIPDAELCVIRDGSHAALIEQPQLISLRLERFLMTRLGMPKMARLPDS